MNKAILSIWSLSILSLPLVSFADLTTDPQGGVLGEYLGDLSEFIFGPLLTFLLAVAFIAFAWGVLKYFIASAEDDKSAAKTLMLYGIGGFVLILVLFGLVNLLVNFTGLGGGGIDTTPGITNPNDS